MDAIPPTVVKVAKAATDASSDGLQIILRTPLDAQSNNLFDLWAGNRHLIIKQYLKPEEWNDAPLREYQALQRLIGQDIAPSPVFYDVLLGPIVVYEFMDGQMWDRRVPKATELEQLAQLWLRLHALPVDNLWPSRGHDHSAADTTGMAEGFFRRFITWVEADFQIGRKALAFIPQLLEQFSSNLTQLEKMEPLLCFGRADARFANVIARPDGQLGLVDWEDCGLRDPARDLGDLLTHPNQEDLLEMVEWQAFLSPYLAERERLDPTIGRRLDLYLAAFPIFWLAVLVNAGVDRAISGTIDDWQINDLSKNLQLRRYLARALAWPNPNFSSTLEDLSDVFFFPARGM